MIFAPFAYKEQVDVVAVTPGVSQDQDVLNWSTATGVNNTSVLTALTTFVQTLKTGSINGNMWDKMILIYPFVTDSTDSATIKTHFKYNLKNTGSLFTASYFNNTSSGSQGGLRMNGSDAFVIPLSMSQFPSNYAFGMYTTNSAALGTDQDIGAENAGSPFDGNGLFVGREVTACGGTFEARWIPSRGCFPFRQDCGGTGTATVKGLAMVAASGSDGFAYRGNTGLVGGPTTGYSAGNRGTQFKPAIGALLKSNTTVANPSRKVYQFGFWAEYLASADYNILTGSVNQLQLDIDNIFSTTRNNRT